MDRDVQREAAAKSEYECLGCSHRVSTADHPIECPECGETMRNLGTPFE
ncbi:rubrerythrin-like domain-containing protein [Halostella salina]|nr:rubrerythrin-like domain-containing protein [Halostella salina]